MIRDLLGTDTSLGDGHKKGIKRPFSDAEMEDLEGIRKRIPSMKISTLKVCILSLTQKTYNNHCHLERSVSAPGRDQRLEAKGGRAPGQRQGE